MGSRALKLQQDSLRSDSKRTLHEKANTWLDAITKVEDYDCHDAPVFKILKLESATFESTKENPNDGKTAFSMTVPRELCNMTGSLHGGIFDICTSAALIVCSKEGFWEILYHKHGADCEASIGATGFPTCWRTPFGFCTVIFLT